MVLGTSFTIKAFDSAQQVEVEVKTGKVSVFKRNPRDGTLEVHGECEEATMITPNQKILYSRSNELIQKHLVDVPEIIASPVASPPVSDFRDAPVTSIFKNLEEAYGIDILIKEAALATASFLYLVEKFTVMRRALRVGQLGLCALISYIFFASCTKKETGDLNEKLETGQKLATKYCGSCHLPPDPGLLDKETWNFHVLPAMAKQLGLEVWQGSKYYQNERSAISLSDWTQLIAYYNSLAPEHLAIPKQSNILLNDWSIFKLKKPQGDPSTIATTTLVSIDTYGKTIWSGNSEQAGLYQWNSNLKQTEFTQLPSPAVAINFDMNGSKTLTCIGEMKAIDIPDGNILSLNTLTSKTNFDTIATGFIRPIQTSSGDFNKDGLMDYVVSSFGHNKGGLYSLEQLTDKSFQKTAIRENPGATQSITGDFNNDGWMDIIALFAHGDEGIWLFTNDKKGGFETRNLLRFPPVYGSSSFQLVDMDADGKMDIIYTAGDNSDYSRILKPYHGVYIFTNTGDFTFKQSYFYQINGCTKATATDFDLDGDMDIATIAFFADFKNNASESFIYFENNPGNTKSLPTFKPISIPVSKYGRWICMDANDIDGDGDMDIVLGNYSKGFLNQDHFKPDWDIHSPFIVLENKITK